MSAFGQYQRQRSESGHGEATDPLLALANTLWEPVPVGHWDLGLRELGLSAEDEPAFDEFVPAHPVPLSTIAATGRDFSPLASKMWSSTRLAYASYAFFHSSLTAVGASAICSRPR